MIIFYNNIEITHKFLKFYCDREVTLHKYSMCAIPARYKILFECLVYISAVICATTFVSIIICSDFCNPDIVMTFVIICMLSLITTIIILYLYCFEIATTDADNIDSRSETEYNVSGANR